MPVAASEGGFYHANCHSGTGRRAVLRPAGSRRGTCRCCCPGGKLRSRLALRSGGPTVYAAYIRPEAVHKYRGQCAQLVLTRRRCGRAQLTPQLSSAAHSAAQLSRSPSASDRSGRAARQRHRQAKFGPRATFGKRRRRRPSPPSELRNCSSRREAGEATNSGLLVNRTPTHAAEKRWH